jgi:ppGpp synthetase/RelA/SpoT-type nucleotidyltranferase
MQKPNDYQDIYAKNFPEIQKCSQSIKENIRNIINDAGFTRIDQISGRAKSIERFKIKALKKLDNEIFKYENPLIEIQDQIGIRIVTFYLSDVEYISKIILDFYESIEELDKHPDRYDAFSYTGKHFILFIPDEDKKWGERGNMPSFFELQIKTMFQHAWAESEHDLNYKTKNELSGEDKRLLAFSAAQAWGADNVFNQLSEKYLDDTHILPYGL